MNYARDYMDHVDIDEEVMRLKSYRDPESVMFPELMTHDEKIKYLATGVIEGWYGEHVVTMAILKNLYGEVMDVVNAMSPEEGLR